MGGGFSLPRLADQQVFRAERPELPFEGGGLLFETFVQCACQFDIATLHLLLYAGKHFETAGNRNTAISFRSHVSAAAG
jgi:hypothetical protein